MDCSRCGRPTPIDSRFCPSCGSELTSVEAAREYRPYQSHNGELTSRDLGSLVRETFAVYAKNWRPLVVIFVGLALAPLVPVAILTLINETLGGFAGTVLFTLLGPIVPIGATLVYIDLRVRKKGYNVDAMAAELGHISATG